jgi:hypothetical protein
MAKKNDKRDRRMPVMRPHAAGMDIGAEEIYVAVPCTPWGFCKVASALPKRYALFAHCGGIAKAYSRWLRNTSCTCRNRSVK